MNVGRTIGPTNVFNSLLDPVDLAAAFQKKLGCVGGQASHLFLLCQTDLSFKKGKAFCFP